MRDEESIKPIGDKRWTFETTSTKEILFKHIVEKKIISDYKKDLKEIGLSDENIMSFEDIFFGDDSLSEREREMFCTVPYEVRLTQFKSFFSENGIDVKDFNIDLWPVFIKYIIDLNIDLEPHIGFHTTPNVIYKEKQKEGRDFWGIRGTEKDHRNSDQPMAFYSLSLEKLFRQKNISKIYIVRANLAEGYNHHPDNDGHWGRAGGLSIISEVDFTDEDIRNLDKAVDSIEKEKVA